MTRDTTETRGQKVSTSYGDRSLQERVGKSSTLWVHDSGLSVIRGAKRSLLVYSLIGVYRVHRCLHHGKKKKFLLPIE